MCSSFVSFSIVNFSFSHFLIFSFSCSVFQGKNKNVWTRAADCNLPLSVSRRRRRHLPSANSDRSRRSALRSKRDSRNRQRAHRKGSHQSISLDFLFVVN